MVAAQTKLDTVTHNLANANTVGYKSERVEFSEALERVLRGEAGLGQVLGTLGTGPIESQRYLVRESGSAIHTNNPLDVSILSSDGAFGVQVNGQRLYTRNGSFTLNGEGKLVTKDGYPVLDKDDRPIELETGKPILIDDKGQVLQGGLPVAELGIWDSAGWKRLGSGLLNAADAKPIEVNLASGQLEGSNVNAVEAMIDMIKLSRVFEMAQKVISTEDEASQKLIQGLQQG